MPECIHPDGGYKGNQVQILSGRATVSGELVSRNATGLRSGKAETSGDPQARKPARCIAGTTFRGRGELHFVFLQGNKSKDPVYQRRDRVFLSADRFSSPSPRYQGENN